MTELNEAVKRLERDISVKSSVFAVSKADIRTVLDALAEYIPTNKLDPQPWLFISDQIFGEHRSAYDRGYHDVSGTYWIFAPRDIYEQDQSKYIG